MTKHNSTHGVKASDGLWQVSYDYGESWVDWPRKPDPVRDAGLAMAKVRHLAGVAGTLSAAEVEARMADGKAFCGRCDRGPREAPSCPHGDQCGLRPRGVTGTPTPSSEEQRRALLAGEWDWSKVATSAPDAGVIASDEGEQESDLVKALAECRDAFPIPAPGAPHEQAWSQAMGDPGSVPAYVRASLAALGVDVPVTRQTIHDEIVRQTGQEFYSPSLHGKPDAGVTVDRHQTFCTDTPTESKAKD